MFESRPRPSLIGIGTITLIEFITNEPALKRNKNGVSIIQSEQSVQSFTSMEQVVHDDRGK